MITTVPDIGPVEVTVTDTDRTRTYLLLHGGGGVATVAAFADLLAERAHARVLVPTHPGFGGTARPAALASVADLARVHVELLDELDLADVTVVGSSFGGWVAAEMALLGSPRVTGIVLVDAVGLDVAGHPSPDVATLTPAELAAHAWFDPSRAPLPPSAGGTGPSPDVLAMAAYTGAAMSDPTLAERLTKVDLPVHVVWGEGDRIVDVAHARAFAEAIPGARLTVLPGTGHLPQLETPEALLGVLLG